MYDFINQYTILPEKILDRRKMFYKQDFGVNRMNFCFLRQFAFIFSINNAIRLSTLMFETKMSTKIKIDKLFKLNNGTHLH